MVSGTHITDLVTEGMNEKLSANFLKAKEKLTALLTILAELKPNVSSPIETLIQTRMQSFISAELDDTLAKLGHGDELDSKLAKDVVRMPSSEMEVQLPAITVDGLKRLYQKFLRVQPDQTFDALLAANLSQTLAKFPAGKHLLANELSNEQGLLHLAREELDQARYALDTADKFFTSQWS
jgi:L-fucose mutarotase/ribose pyranase (RbsD/FucU family)